MADIVPKSKNKPRGEVVCVLIPIIDEEAEV